MGQRWGSGGAASTQIDPSPSRKEHPSSFKAGGCDGFDVLGVGSRWEWAVGGSGERRCPDPWGDGPGVDAGRSLGRS